MKPDEEAVLIQDQIDYYRARAAEYDETSTPTQWGDPLGEEGERIEQALHDFAPSGDVLEIACGTGTWTRRLAAHADSVLAMDASPEMIEQAKRKAPHEHVTYVNADIFTWTPPRTFDVVFFANWLSHVPSTRFEAFWGLVANALNPGGRVFFTDENSDAWRHEKWLQEETVERILQDGSVHRAVKIFYDPDELNERLRGLGWDLTMLDAGSLFAGWGGLQTSG